MAILIHPGAPLTISVMIPIQEDFAGAVMLEVKYFTTHAARLAATREKIAFQSTFS